VGVCARFQANPKESHLTTVKCIIKYVNDTFLYGIWYSRETNPVVVGYSDADWTGNADDRKSKVCNKNIDAEIKTTHRFLLTTWKLNQEKNHSGAAKPRNSTIQKTKLDTR
jgi:hypothetical protein